MPTNHPYALPIPFFFFLSLALCYRQPWWATLKQSPGSYNILIKTLKRIKNSMSLTTCKKSIRSKPLHNISNSRLDIVLLRLYQHLYWKEGDSMWKHQEKNDNFFLDFRPKKSKVFDILVIKTFFSSFFFLLIFDHFNFF